MPEIIISVKNKIPSVIGDTRTIVTDNSDYTIRFIFDEQWDESEKVVYLIRSNCYAYPPISTTDDVVEVPVQHKAGLGAFLLVGIQQGNIKTSAAAHIAIRASAIDAIDDEAVQPSAELWNEVLQRLRDVEESISPEELERIVDEYLKENPITESVKSVNGQTGEVKLNAADIGALPASTQIPGKTSDLQNDSGFITRLVSDLANYYTKNQTYSREEVDARVSAIPKFSISVVSSLPTSNISETTVYLVKAGSASGDMYTEYIRANGAWEILGSQRVDLTGYATESWVNLQLADYLTADKLTAAIITGALGYVPADAKDVDELSEAIADKADKAGWMPNKYIGTDAEGNIIEKDDPTGGDGWTIDGLTAETVIADDDAVPFYDTSAKGQRKTLWGNIKTVLKTYFDGVYLKLSGGTLNGKIVLLTDNQNVGFTNSGDRKIFGYGNINSVSHLRVGDADRPLQLRGSTERPKYNDGELVLKSEFDTALGSYIADIDALIGGDE